MRALLLLAALPLFAQQAQLSTYADLSGEWGAVQLPWKTAIPAGTTWLRKTVPIPAAITPDGMAIALGSIDSTYEVYANDISIGHSIGSGDNPPQMFPLPAEALRGYQELTVSIRFDNPRPLLRSPISGLPDNGPYVLGPSDAVRSIVEGTIAKEKHRRSGYLVMSVVAFLSAIYVLTIWRSVEQRPVFLWLSLFLMFTAVNNGRYCLITGQGQPLVLYSIAPLLYALLGESAMAGLQIPPKRWRWVFWSLTVAGQILAIRWPYEMTALSISQLLMTFGLALVSLFRGTGGVRSFAIPLLLYSATVIGLQLRILPGNFRTGSWIWPLSTSILLPSTMAMVVVLLKELAADRREKHRLAHEVEAARVVQQLLLSQPPPTSGEYAVETEYRPAQEVGGDFFYWLKTNDSSLLLATGDVSGKGLKAAMLVSLIIGALRRAADDSPGRILASLNEAVHGQTGGGFVTCCCARFEPGGTVTLANAGHVLPYIGTVEAAVTSGLPLGLTNSVSYDESTITLRSGVTMTFVSDGVVEATNPTGELFGFDRTRAIAGQPARDIVAAAQAFGQNDDITVVTVRRRS